MTTKDIVHISLFAAITAVLGIIPIMGLSIINVPLSLQPLGPMLAGSILGAKKGSLSQILFLMLVIIGLPVLSSKNIGLGALLGPSGGFLIGWPIAAFMIGFLFERNWNKLTTIKAYIYILLSTIICMYSIGCIWLSIITNITINQALMGSIIFIPGEVVKALIATTIALTIKRSYPIIGK